MSARWRVAGPQAAWLRLSWLGLVVSVVGVLIPGVLVFAQDGGTEDALLAAAEARQVIQFNPQAALQKQVFADGFVPNSAEFNLDVAGTTYAAQRAENLATGQVRVYFVAVGDWGNLRFVARDAEEGNSLATALLTAGEARQMIRFNPEAALQKRIFADGFVPNSAEFGVDVAGIPHTGQRAENLADGQVRVYYVVDREWGDVRHAARGAAQAGAPPPQPRPTPARPAQTLVPGAATPGLSVGAVRPISVANCPADHPIKGNQGSNGWVYHAPGWPYYNQTHPEECFATGADAAAAGYRAAQH